MSKTAEPSSSADKLNRIVDGTNIVGEIVSDSNIRIDGKVEGTISVKGRLVVGPTGVIKGEVVCENADVEGSISGKFSVNGLLTLKSTANLQCDILTKKLAIEPGATFTGTCAMGGAVVKEIQNRDKQALPNQPKAVEERSA